MIDYLGVPKCESQIGLGYIYCDYKDQKEQTTENILRAVLTQLVESLPKIPAAVLDIHKQRVKKNRPLGVENTSKLLQIICAQFCRVYIYLDALDKLQPIYLEELSRRLYDAPSVIQIFIPGRPHVQKAVQKFTKTDTGITIKSAQKRHQKVYQT